MTATAAGASNADVIAFGRREQPVGVFKPAAFNAVDHTEKRAPNAARVCGVGHSSQHPALSEPEYNAPAG